MQEPKMDSADLHIPKLAVGERFRRPVVFFPSARAGLHSLLVNLRIPQGRKVLLPGYIGWSAREGSGVFDPVRESGVEYSFYRMTRSLHIDLEDFESQLKQGTVSCVVLIHYFGAPDPSYHTAAQLARDYGAFLVEDEAHALFTDWAGGLTGRLGDAAIFSLHKMLPMADGGILSLRNGTRSQSGDWGQAVNPTHYASVWEYDIQAIASQRVQNARQLAQLLQPLSGEIEPLWNCWNDRVVPQTFPVIVRSVSRDDLYFGMNAAGFGVVSLYHTLISELSPEAHGDAHWLSRHILNLPIHQDVSWEQMNAMVEELARQIRHQSRPR